MVRTTGSSEVYPSTPQSSSITSVARDNTQDLISLAPVPKPSGEIQAIAGMEY